MEWLGQLWQDLSQSDGWSGWKLALVSSGIGGIIVVVKLYVNKLNANRLINKDSVQEVKMSEKKNEEQEISLAESIKAIEKLHANSRDKQAYEKFYQLCKGYPDFQPQAAAILARFSNFQNQCISGILPMHQRSTTKSEIGYDFQTCLRQFKQEISDK